MALTHQGGQLSICTTAQTANLPLNLAAFEGLTFVDVAGVVTMPSLMVMDNILTQNTLDSDIAQKQKGFRSIEDGELVCAFDEGDAGQSALITASLTQNIYAFKYELNNAGATNGTIFYFVAIVGGGDGITGGGGEDFVNRNFQLGLTHQAPIRDAAA